ncbi:MAG: bifunctional MaoC family dehydratase N-terminal/OB-fold nucleic acid binding domain-containing protein [Pseudomonadota bacterium]
MTPEERQAFEEELQTFVGRALHPEPKRSYDAVNEAMIRHWAEVMGDKNPAYTDAAWAADSQRGELIAPPAMMYAWNQEGYAVASEGRPSDGLSDLVGFFDQHGFTGSLGTNVDQEFFAEAKIGDALFEDAIIEEISEQKITARGQGYFLQTLAKFSNQAGELIGTQRFRVFKFIPPEAPPQAAASSTGDELEMPTRIHAPRGQDNGWWWDACDEGKVLIQRCKNCQTLRHPPRPMCGECQSTDWDSVESTLDGEIFSFVEMHYPKFPGYKYPLIVAVISLAEGTRIISNVVGIESDEVTIGMKVKGKVVQVDEKTMLPQFYPVEV